MIWIIVCGGILLMILSYGAGTAIVGDDESVLLTLAVGFVTIGFLTALTVGLCYGISEVTQ